MLLRKAARTEHLASFHIYNCTIGLMSTQDRTLASSSQAKGACDGYINLKEPTDLEDGVAAHQGGAPIYTSPQVLAVLAHYFSVGLVYGALPFLPYAVLVNYFHVSGAEFTSAKGLIQLGWSFKVFVGMLSDALPIMGYRRKSYMMLGWFIAGTCLLVLALLNHGEPYNPSSTSKKGPFNVGAVVNGNRVGLLCALVTIGYIVADAPADAMVVEYAQREPQHLRGRMHMLAYGVRTTASVLTTLVVGICLNSQKYQGSFTWDMGLNNMFVVLCVPSFLTTLITYVFVQDNKVARGLEWIDYWTQLWALVQRRCVWQLMLFNFFFHLFGFYCTTTAAPYVLSDWARLENLDYAALLAISTVVFVTVFATWGLSWNWRTFLVLSTIGISLLNAVAMYLTIYDYVRNQWIYFGVVFVDHLPLAVQLITSMVVAAQIADDDNQGVVVGLLTSCANLAAPVGAMITNGISSQFRIKDLQYDDNDDTRNQVATSYAIYYGFTAVAACLVVFFPANKKMLQEWTQEGALYPKVGAATLIVGVLLLIAAVTSNLLTMF
ncbi:Aste57867_3281 [Aphanomyces stellatus]|uniref:Aste57867_3281 protein n=1 Tax=Aphanomyces stellatus TaxID=120398 RepID=A0A485KA35_9STRA|nr:hypothetical protein As57867_003271 [Aphanomyces stellatus]VFT80453.1 Aste57867_3281 [Aphanomyces stellatus]